MGRDLLVAARRGTSAAAHAAPDQALQEEVGDGPAISLLVLAAFMHRFEQLPRHDGGHVDRIHSPDPDRPTGADHLFAFAGPFRGGGYSVEVPRARIRLVLEHGLDLTPVPQRTSHAGRQRRSSREREMVTSPKRPLANISKIDRTTGACSSLTTSAAGAAGSFSLVVSVDAVAVAARSPMRSRWSRPRVVRSMILARSNSATAPSTVTVNLFSGLLT